MSNDLSHFTFQLDNQVYKLPFPYEDLSANGWELNPIYSAKEGDLLESNQFQSVHMIKNDVYIEVTAINTTDASLPLSQCNIAGIVFSYRDYDEDEQNIDFKIAHDITLKSPVESVLRTFGNPSKQEYEDNKTSLTYIFIDKPEFELQSFTSNYQVLLNAVKSPESLENKGI